MQVYELSKEVIFINQLQAINKTKLRIHNPNLRPYIIGQE